MLTGVLSGGAYGNDVGAPDDLERPQKSAYFFMAIKIESFMEVSQFQARSQDLVQRLKSASDAQVRMPGENSGKNYAASLSDGIAVRASAIKTLDKIFNDIGLGGWDDLVAKTR
jgi:LDH2 family malate/lactate/ureidoglycolate dehydrogenase